MTYCRGRIVRLWDSHDRFRTFLLSALSYQLSVFKASKSNRLQCRLPTGYCVLSTF